MPQRKIAETSSSVNRTIDSPANLTQLEELINSLRVSPIPNLHEILTHTSHDLLTCLPSEGQTDLLDEIDQPDLDRILYFHILMSRLGTRQDKVAPQKTLSHAHKFCATINRKQLQLISSRNSPNLYLFAQYLTQISSQVGQLKSSIEPLFKLIKSYGQLHILTPLHHELLKISLQSRSIQFAVRLTDLDIDIDQEVYTIRYQDHLIYHYLAGTVQALNKNYQRAIHLFTIVVSAPGPGVSQIQVDAYKKLILISLLRNSSSPTLPPYTNPQFKSAFRSVNSHTAYLEFMNLSELAETTSEGYEQLLRMAEKNKQIFQKDDNYALIQLCISSLPKKAIKKLIPIYSSIPILTIDKMLGSLTNGNANLLAQSMIQSGELNAEIDRNTNVIKFFDEGKAAQDLQQTQQTLKQIIKTVQSTEQSIKEISAGIARDKEFLKRLVQDLKWSITDKHHSSPNEILQSVASSGIDKNFSGIIEEDLAVDVGVAWDFSS